MAIKERSLSQEPDLDPNFYLHVIQENFKSFFHEAQSVLMSAEDMIGIDSRHDGNKSWARTFVSEGRRMRREIGDYREAYPYLQYEGPTSEATLNKLQLLGFECTEKANGVVVVLPWEVFDTSQIVGDFNDNRLYMDIRLNSGATHGDRLNWLSTSNLELSLEEGELRLPAGLDLE